MSFCCDLNLKSNDTEYIASLAESAPTLEDLKRRALTKSILEHERREEQRTRRRTPTPIPQRFSLAAACNDIVATHRGLQSLKEKKTERKNPKQLKLERIAMYRKASKNKEIPVRTSIGFTEFPEEDCNNTEYDPYNPLFR